MINQNKKFGNINVSQFKPSLADNKVVIEISWVSPGAVGTFGATRFYQDLGAAIEFSENEYTRLKLEGYQVIQRSHDRAASCTK